MLYELKPHLFQRLAHLQTDIVNLEPIAIIAGHNPGWIFVDDTERPTSALIWSQGMQGFYLVGNETNRAFTEGLNALVDDVLKPRLTSLSLRYFEVSGGKPQWNPVIETVFGARKLDQWTQRIYTYTESQAPSLAINTDTSVRITPIKELLVDASIANRQLVTSAIEQYWGGTAAFLAQGFGYYAVKQQTVASVCYASFVADNTCALGVVTSKEYRQQGLALGVAAQCVNYAVAIGKKTYWDCTDTNLGSIRIAERLGFALCGNYQCYGFELD